MSQSDIFVTRPFLPPLEEFTPYLKAIWESRQLTNNGPYHKQLEEALCEHLGVKHISLFCNGTLALLTALQALNISGEVITTPYSFVATSHALWWNKLTPVFVDVDQFGNLDPQNIEKAITPKTSAILAIHVYGNPCNVDEISKISRKFGIPVIYDAAHAFDVKLRSSSILHHGALSVLSFHATKVFTTFEGGAIVCHDPSMKRHIDDLKNFGFRNEVTVVSTGINGKMNEIQAAMGLLQLKYVKENILARRRVVALYREALLTVSGIRMLPDMPDVQHNYAYFPIFIDKEEYGCSRDQLYNELKTHNINSRRYFFPLISEFEPYNKLESAKSSNLNTASRLSEQVICLPLFPDLSASEQEWIISVVKK